MGRVRFERPGVFIVGFKLMENLPRSAQEWCFLCHPRGSVELECEESRKTCRDQVTDGEEVGHG